MLTPRLTPNTKVREPLLAYDFPGIGIGVATYEEGPTGCTVVHFAPHLRTRSVVDLRGGSHATIFTDFHERGWSKLDAICLSGGSLMGLEAACGVSTSIFSSRTDPTCWQNIPLVSGGVIYDFSPRGTTIYPDSQLGIAAYESVREGILPLGEQGAGRAATVGKLFELEGSASPLALREPGGQGGAYAQFGDTKILVLTVVNALGALVNRKGQTVRGFKQSTNPTTHISKQQVQRYLRASCPVTTTTGGNTTLTVVVTNVALDYPELQQFARAIHSSMARAIQPFHLCEDGDVLWAVSTQQVAHNHHTTSGLTLLAAELAWDAVLSSYEVSTFNMTMTQLGNLNTNDES